MYYSYDDERNLSLHRACEKTPLERACVALFCNPRKYRARVSLYGLKRSAGSLASVEECTPTSGPTADSTPRSSPRYRHENCSLTMGSSRLPQVPYLKVKDTRLGQKQAGTCVVALTNLLSCWASNGEGAAACKHLEQELKECMVGRKYVKAKRSTVNYHSNRLLGKINPKPHD